jgi:hypothetical protein
MPSRRVQWQINKYACLFSLSLSLSFSLSVSHTHILNTHTHAPMLTCTHTFFQRDEDVIILWLSNMLIWASVTLTSVTEISHIPW